MLKMCDIDIRFYCHVCNGVKICSRTTLQMKFYYPIEVNYFHANIFLALLRWENKATPIYITNKILNLEGSFINLFTLFQS